MYMKKFIKMFPMMLLVSLLLLGMKMELKAVETEDSYSGWSSVEGMSHQLVPNTRFKLSIEIEREYYDEGGKYCVETFDNDDLTNINITFTGESAKYASAENDIVSIKKDIPEEAFDDSEWWIPELRLEYTVSATVNGEEIVFDDYVTVWSRYFEFYLNQRNNSVVMDKGEVVTLHPVLIIYDADYPDGAEVEDVHYYISYNGQRYENETLNYGDFLKIKVTDNEFIMGAKKAGNITLDNLYLYLLDENGERDYLPELNAVMNFIFPICIRPESTPALTADSTGTVNVPEDIGVFTFTPKETGKYHFTFKEKMDEDGDYYINNDCYDDQGDWVGESSDDDNDPSPYITYLLEKGVTYTFFYNYTGDLEPLADIDLNTDVIIPETETTEGEGNKIPTVPVVSGNSTELKNPPANTASSSNLDPAVESKNSSVNTASNGNSNLPAVNSVLTDMATQNVYVVTTKGSTVAYKGTKNKNVKKITIPTTVKLDGITYKITSISAGAFKNNKKLTRVTVGNKVTTIGKNAFAGCKKLKKVIVKTKVLKKIGKNAFKGINKAAKIKVPKKNLTVYKKLFKKAKLAKSVKITK